MSLAWACMGGRGWRLVEWYIIGLCQVVLCRGYWGEQHMDAVSRLWPALPQHYYYLIIALIDTEFIECVLCLAGLSHRAGLSHP